MKINRCFAMPDKATFTIQPIKDVLLRYIRNWKNWADPFAGYNSPAYWTNDLNPEAPTRHHMDAREFLDTIVPDGLEGFIFDPPYSPRQVSECYKQYGYEVTMETTQATFWSNIKDLAAQKIQPGGWAICCGWNSMGLGLNRDFRMKEILLVSHGGFHNDTIVTVEQKRGKEQKEVVGWK